MAHSGSERRAGRRLDSSDIQRASGDALGHGLTMAAAIGLFLWVGDRADRVLGTGPVLAVAGAVTGAVAGFYRLYAHLTALQDFSGPKDDRSEDSE